MKVVAGEAHSCGIRGGGSLWCWGANAKGGLGDGTTNDRSAPTEVIGGQSWVDITAGYRHSCGVDEGGQLWCWGEIQGGVAPLKNFEPQAVDFGQPWEQIGGFGEHLCGVVADRSGWCLGANGYGQLGDGSADFGQEPVPVLRP